MDGKQILKKFEGHEFDKEDSKLKNNFYNDLKHYFDPNTPTHERISGGMISNTIGFMTGLYNRKLHKDFILNLMDDMVEFENFMGYRRLMDIVTLQEHSLLGFGKESHPLDSGEHYTVKNINPYLSSGLIKKSSIFKERYPFSLEEINKARELAKYTNANPFFYGLESNEELRNPKSPQYIYVTLELLNDLGETVRDPQPIDQNLQIIKNYNKNKHFPFKRDN